MGPQGSGKGLMMKFARESGEEVYASSEEMRKHPTYPNILKIMENGGLVPDNMVLKVFEEYLNGLQLKQDNNIYLDGFPRTLPQQNALDKLLQEKGFPLPLAVLLKIGNTREEIKNISLESMLFRARRMEAKGEEPRKDDVDKQARESRVEDFFRYTLPVIEAYNENGRLIVIDAKPQFDYSTLRPDEGVVVYNHAKKVYAALQEALATR